MKIGSKEWSHLLVEGAKSFNLSLNRDQIEQFAVHAKELIQWNQSMNLTALTDPLAIGIKHFLDSLAPTHLIPPRASVLDIGSGGGFPGIPLKVIDPSLSVTLIDASRKKVNFMKHIIRTLNLNKTEALHRRAQDLVDDPAHRFRFDVVISRALSALDVFAELALPLLAKEGILIAPKGALNPNELDDLKRKLAEQMAAQESMHRRYAIGVEKYGLPVFHLKRSIVTVKPI
jgi:16S rRNA (guanine527-N7)-methyltransferase